MGSHRADDGRYMGAAYDALQDVLTGRAEVTVSEYGKGDKLTECPACQRTGWILSNVYGRYYCAGCGFWPIPQNSSSPPIAKTTDSYDTPTPIDVMKATVDGWSDEQRSAAYKYLHVAYKQRL